MPSSYSVQVLLPVFVAVFVLSSTIAAQEPSERGGFAACEPGAGDCYQPHGNAGCGDVACCNSVCNQDQKCCLVFWDSTCASEASQICGGGGGACPAAGSCFSQHGNPGCNDANCCSAVCAEEPLCCAKGFDWDGTCVSVAQDVCQTGGTCPGAGSCFEPHGSGGCSDAECCNRVCAQDSECCSGSWDSLCVNRAREVCGCAGEGNCFTAHPSPSCDNDNCCSTVCAQDPYCCDAEWDCVCADLAAELCGSGGCPGVGGCLEPHDTSGCADEACCNTVCATDPDCCQFEWDSLCVNRARASCTTCPGTGSCLVPDDTPGCETESCCSAVCAQDAWCCSVEWDARCAAAARDICGHNACPGTNDCNQAGATPGCSDEACCQAVCLTDPDCCEVVWDALCVQRAAEVCDGCPGRGRCEVPHAGSGCENNACCQAVCAARPDCCRGDWTLECVLAAEDLCSTPLCPGEGDCFTVHANPGCEDEDCCRMVCLSDPFCCGASWDPDCVATAGERCTTPFNDEPENAIPIGCGESLRGTTINANVDVDISACPGLPEPDAPGVWYRVLPRSRQLVRVSTCSHETNFDTRLAVYQGKCERDLSCVMGNDNVACVLNFRASSVEWTAEEGVRYLIRVYGSEGNRGEFVLSHSCPESCPRGPVNWIDPPVGVVDARQPHPVASVFPPQGIDRIRVQAPAGADEECWRLCETQVDGVPVNAIVHISEDAPGMYTLTLARPIAAGAVATVSYGEGARKKEADFTAHPANVNGDSGAGPIDILNIVDCINGVNMAVACPWGLYSCDADHSRECNAQDILRVIDLINGAQTFAPGWNDTDRPVNGPPCSK